VVSALRCGSRHYDFVLSGYRAGTGTAPSRVSPTRRVTTSHPLAVWRHPCFVPLVVIRSVLLLRICFKSGRWWLTLADVLLFPRVYAHLCLFLSCGNSSRAFTITSSRAASELRGYME